MVSRTTILVEAQISGTEWTPGAAAAIEQAGMLASCSQSTVHLLTAVDADESDAGDSSVSENPSIQRLHLDTASALKTKGVKMTSDLVLGGKSTRGQTGQPAPLSFAFLSLPDLIDEESAEHRTQVLEECRSDLWLAVPEAFDRDVPCCVVYDDLTSNGDQALRAAVSVGQQLQTRLLVVHAVPEGAPAARQEQVSATLQNRLFDTDFRTLDQGTRLFVETGSIDAVLKQAVQEQQASLVVLSWPDGPVSAETLPDLMWFLSAARCSLLLVRTHDFAKQAVSA